MSELKTKSQMRRIAYSAPHIMADKYYQLQVKADKLAEAIEVKIKSIYKSGGPYASAEAMHLEKALDEYRGKNDNS